MSNPSLYDLITKDEVLLAQEPEGCWCGYCKHIQHRLEGLRLALSVSPSPQPRHPIYSMSLGELEVIAARGVCDSGCQDLYPCAVCEAEKELERRAAFGTTQCPHCGKDTPHTHPIDRNGNVVTSPPPQPDNYVRCSNCGWEIRDGICSLSCSGRFDGIQGMASPSPTPPAPSEDTRMPIDESHWRSMSQNTVNHFWFSNREVRVLFAEIDRLRASASRTPPQENIIHNG